MSQTVVDKLRDSLSSFPATERRVAHRLLADYPLAGLQSASELARAHPQAKRCREMETHFIVGITNSAPPRLPVGQRAVMVLSLL